MIIEKVDYQRVTVTLWAEEAALLAQAAEMAIDRFTAPDSAATQQYLETVSAGLRVAAQVADHAMNLTPGAANELLARVNGESAPEAAA